MVAPHVETQLTRSLVRVPNSGGDRRAGSILHDLSRVSSAAALVPITSYLAVGMLPSGTPTPPPSSPFPLDESSMKLSTGGGFEAGARAAAENRPLQVGAVPLGVWSGTTSRFGMMSSDGSRGGTVAPLRAAPRTVTNTTTAIVNPASGRKRSLPMMVQDTTRTTTEGIKSPKVSRTTTMKPTQQSRRPASRRRAEGAPSVEHLLRERDELRAEQLVLKQRLIRQFQQRLTAGPGSMGL